MRNESVISRHRVDERAGAARVSGQGRARFWAAYRMELRLIVRNLPYLALQLAWAAMILGPASSGSQTLGIVLEISTGRTAIGLLSLLTLFLTGLSAVRSPRSRFEALEDAYPTGLEVLVGRWLAAVSAIAPFLIAPVAVALSVGPMEAFIALVPTYLMDALLTIAFTAAASYALTGLIGPRRWTYPALALIWLAFSMVPTMTAVSAPFISLFNFARLNQVQYSELWGRMLWGDVPRAFNLFYLGLTLAMLAFLGGKYIGRRFHRRSLRALGMVALALAIAFAGGSHYWTLSAASESRAIRSTDIATEVESGTLQHPNAAASVADAYDMQVDLSGSETARFTVDVTLRNRSGEPIREIDLTLNRAFRITEANVPYRHDGDILRLNLPEELAPNATFMLRLRYEGTLWRTIHWTARGQIYATDFIRAGGVRLSHSAAWYPQVGRLPVHIDSWYVPVAHARFNLRVTGSDLTLASNLPARGENEWRAEAAHTMYLVGAPGLKREQIGPFILIGKPISIEQVRESIQSQYLPAWEYLKRFFPTSHAAEFVMVLDDLAEGLLAKPVADRTALIAAPVGFVRSITDWPDNGAYFIGAQLTYAYLNDVPGLLNSMLAQYLWMHYEHRGNAQVLSAMLENDGMGIMKAFHELYMAEGDAGLIALTTQIQADVDKVIIMSPEEAVEYVRAVLAEVKNAR